MPNAWARRIAYEQAVRALALVAAQRRSAGDPPEAIARDAVAARNCLKAAFRTQDDPRMVALMEARNRAKYGDPVGPSADDLLIRYGSWTLVIEAACRPARLAD